MIKDGSINKALYGAPSRGPTFGGGFDLVIFDQSNISSNSYSFISDYSPPSYPSGSDSYTFLTYNWLTSEIEVYQLNLIEVPAVLSSSTILSSTELSNLNEMLPTYTKSVLLYKATRDGFESKEFHDRCDNAINTVIVIRNNLNYIFGGFTVAKWGSNLGYITDWLFCLICEEMED